MKKIDTYHTYNAATHTMTYHAALHMATSYRRAPHTMHSIAERFRAARLLPQITNAALRDISPPPAPPCQILPYHFRHAGRVCRGTLLVAPRVLHTTLAALSGCDAAMMYEDDEKTKRIHIMLGSWTADLAPFAAALDGVISPGADAIYGHMPRGRADVAYWPLPAEWNAGAETPNGC